MIKNGYLALYRVLFLALVVAFGTDLHAGTAEAKAVVDKLHSALLDVMKRADVLGYRGRYEVLAPVVSASFDFATIGQQLLGRHWAGLSPDQRTLFLESFEKLSTATYASRFDGFDNERFRDVAQDTKGDWVVVTTELVKSDGDAVQFKYILKSQGGRWVILNVFADGVSELAARKAEYSTVIKGRGFDALIAEIKGKIGHYEKGA